MPARTLIEIPADIFWLVARKYDLEPTLIDGRDLLRVNELTFVAEGKAA